MLRVICELIVGVFEHLETTSDMDFDKRIKFKQHILRRRYIKKYKHVLAGCKDLEKVLAGDQWELGATNYVTMEHSELGRILKLHTDQYICT